MKLKITLCLSALVMGLNFQKANAQCDTASISGNLLVCDGDSTILSGPSPWAQKTSAPISRDGGASFSIGSKAYVGLGWQGTNMGDASFWEYDPATDAWTQKANFPQPGRMNPASFSIGTKGYVGCGFMLDNFGTIDQVYSDFYEYDPTGNVWTQKANYPGGGRCNPVNFAMGTKGYIGAGFEINNSAFANASSVFYEYESTNDTWTQKSNVPMQGAPNKSISIASKGYVVGTSSIDVFNDYVYTNNVYEYNPNNDTWTQKTSYPGQGQGVAAGFAIGNEGYFGFRNGINEFWKYVPATDTWSASYNEVVLSNRIDPLCFSIDSIGYVYGGFDGNTGLSYNSLWRFLPFTSYSWSTGDTTQSITVTTAGTYTLNMTFPFGCPPSSESATVVFNSKPTLSVSGNDTICAGQTATFTASGTGTSYEWSTGDTTANVSIYSTMDTTLYVTASNANNCSTMDTINLVVNALPMVTVMGDDSLMLGESTTLVAGGGVSYEWSTGEMTDTLILSPTADTVYFVTVTGSNGCTAIDSVEVFVTVGVNELSLNETISLYPNPAKNLVKVRSNGVTLETIKIYNLAGAIVYEQLSNKSEEVLNLNIPTGVYYMHLKTEVGTSVKKLVIQ
ncbi:MAG: T9SS type A sorting domain-containing protein [Bacteroidia bacterium]